MQNVTPIESETGAARSFDLFTPVGICLLQAAYEAGLLLLIDALDGNVDEQTIFGLLFIAVIRSVLSFPVYGIVLGFYLYRFGAQSRIRLAIAIVVIALLSMTTCIGVVMLFIGRYMGTLWFLTALAAAAAIITSATVILMMRKVSRSGPGKSGT